MTRLLDTIMSFIYDQLLDDWNLPTIPVGYKRQAVNVAFNLAFNSKLTSDNTATIASKRGVVRI